MEAYIRYKRIHEDLHADGIQYNFNELVTEGWEIIYYNEKPIGADDKYFTVTIVAGKKQNRVL